MKPILYPKQFDTDENLYKVQDALLVSLAYDYHPGQSTIISEGNISKFPSSGIITLVEQYSDPKERAVSFYYGSRTNREFNDLQLISEKAYFKPKKITKITMQVMANHREALKDSILAIEKTLGAKHTFDKATIFGRLNNLRKVIFAPKAWFEASTVIGVAPLTVNFKFAGSGHTGPVGDVSYLWKFDDEEMVTSEVEVEKTFLNSGSHTVSLTVKNDYGEDTVKFADMVRVKSPPPEEAAVNFIPQSHQVVAAGKIRTPANFPVQIEVPKGTINNKTYAGELLNETTKKPVDPIHSYTWNLADDLSHAQHSTTKALYSMGGYYDAVVKTKTTLGAYRTTIIPQAIDVVEPVNLWLWDIKDNAIKSYEFGLLSEVFKSSASNYHIVANDTFLKPGRESFEFWRNNGIISQGSSGLMGTSLIFWASGRSSGDNASIEKVNAVEYQGFTDIYTNKPSLTSRPWNWASFVDKTNVYFILGNMASGPYPTLSMTNQNRTVYDLKLNASKSEEMSYTGYLNGSVDLMVHPGVFTSNFDAPHGHFAAYRTTWKGNTGYMLRNSDLGDNFTFKDFYRTSGTLGSPVQQMVKLPSLPDEIHKEGDLVALAHGIYFFSNFGLSYCFNDLTGVWETIPAHNKVASNQLDKLLAASDNESKAYISIDNGMFFKFNESSMTYTTLPCKPNNDPWLMTIC